MQAEETVAPNNMRGNEALGPQVRDWFRDHSVAGVALAVTLLAAAGYCVHRSWLFGWYQAAGIPPFAHGWSAQDIVMLGITNLAVWLFGLIAVVVLGIGAYLELLVLTLAERWVGARLASRKKARDADAPKKARSSAVQAGLSRAAGCALFALGAVLLYVLIAIGVLLLSSQPREFGRNQFQKVAQYAETTVKGSTAPSENEVPAKEAFEEAMKHMLTYHKYVRVTVGTGEAREHHCGWLVLQNGEHMLLLGRSGSQFLSATGLGFSWAPVKMNEC